MSEYNSELLNSEQKQLYDYIVAHQNKNNNEQLLLIIYGAAGTGKSYVTHCIYEELNRNAQRCLITGVISVQNVYSLCKLPVENFRQSKLNSFAKRVLQKQFDNIDYLIIEGFSMLGQKTFKYLDIRLREATGKEISFGGINVVLVGDFAQLYPFNDLQVFKKPPEKRDQHGYKVYQLFKCWILNTYISQNNEFNMLLSALRNGALSSEQLENLSLTRSPKVLSKSELQNFNNAVRVFQTYGEVSAFNLRKIKENHNAMYYVRAYTPGHDNNMVVIGKGARIILNINLCPSKGLIAGSFGTVEEIVFENVYCKLPLYVLAQFDDYSGYGIKVNNKICVPIVPIEFNAEQRLPIQLGYACTLRSLQGKKLNKCIIDLGKKTITSDFAYFAMSRVSDLSDVVLAEPFKIERCRTFCLRIKEEKRLCNVKPKNI